MEKTYNAAVMQQVRDYMARYNISQNQLADMVPGVSQGALSAYMNQNYNGSTQNVERKLTEFFRVAGEQAAEAERAGEFSRSDDYVPTSISEDVYQSIRYAQVAHCIVMLFGDAGVGKTAGAEKFREDHPDSTILIKVEPCTGTLSGIVQAIASRLNIQGRNNAERITNIHEKLDGTNSVLIIDEAQVLNYSALDQLRALNDENPNTGKGGIGIALVGNSDLYDRLQGRQRIRYQQLRNRVQIPREYRNSKVTMSDVELLFPALVKRDMRKELEFLLSVARGELGLRCAVKLYENAVREKDVSYDRLYNMAVNTRVDRLR